MQECSENKRVKNAQLLKQSQCKSLSKKYITKNQVDARYIMFFFLFTASSSLHFSLFQSLFAFFLFSAVLLFKYKEKNKKMHLYTLLFVFCFFCFLFSFLIKSIDYENTFVLKNVHENLLFSFEYALHLFLLGIIGLCLFIWQEAKEYACAITWYCSFFSRKHAWKLGLVSLLVLRYFSTLLIYARELKIAVQYRLRKGHSFTKKVSLYMVNLFSMFCDKNYDLSVALFARKMNRPEAFHKKWPKSPFLSFQNFKAHFLPFLLFFFSLIQVLLLQIL